MAGRPTLRSGVFRVEAGVGRLRLDALADYVGRMGYGLEAVLLPWTDGQPTSSLPQGDPSADVRLRLRELTLQHGVKPLARRAGVPHSTILRWCSGEYQHIELTMLERVAVAAGTRPESIILGRLGAP